ncbi:MAG: hypothetical protein KJ767_01300 [Nanoarchaeota archaeon]|nr:hypothetical protein [Nanoarchaeota archaeon]
MKIIFWSEFPNKINWKKVKELFSKYNLKADIYVACKNLSEYKKWKNKISCKNIEVGAWPVLSKKHGYWFSGFTSKKDIDKLNSFSGEKIKIDLEIPFPSWKYSDSKMFLYILQFFKKGKNNKYLEKTITRLSKTSKILVNEFPFPKFLLKNTGTHYNINDKIEKNIMLYTTITNKFFKPILKPYLQNYARKAVKENKNVTFSIGLIGKGILQNEGIYKDIDEFKNDLDFMKTLKSKSVAIYSIDAIMKKPEEWINLISKY